tara:strand:- start:10953 stop:11525 length:573 start_codon:yes stop_codon:yes gene_type:complete
MQEYLLDAALQYAELGYCLVPLIGNTEKPAIKNWTQEASNDLRQLKKWFLNNNYNIGIAMRKSGIVAVDFNNKKTAREFYSRLGTNNISIVVTRKSFKFWFRAPENEMGNTSNIFSDIRRLGDHVVAPPSIVRRFQYFFAEGFPLRKSGDLEVFNPACLHPIVQKNCPKNFSSDMSEHDALRKVCDVLNR